MMRSEYNRRMSQKPQLLVLFMLLPSFFLLPAAGQAGNAKPAPAAGDTERAVSLAESGRCPEALPLLKRAIRQTANHDLKKRIGLDGLHCAMAHDTPYDSLDFLSVLTRDFPHDPDVLYAATHAFSGLSMRTSQDLAKDAPFSFQVHE